MTSKSDLQISALAAGFTIGFGFLTVWEAIKQTRRNRNPLRSVYIYMLWGEIVANLAIGVIGWIWLDGVFGDKPTIPLLFFILFFWVFEIQLLMQIIINRIAVIAENPDHIRKLKWGTAAVITLINIAVFCIFIPAHMVPPVSQLYADINKVWDRISKILILLVDAGLNFYFSKTVKNRLVKQHGLLKYAPLASFNNKLMVVSILMDLMLIGLMSLPNQVVFVQFHPVVYMVKLNIEMSMANLITKVAQNGRKGNSDEEARQTSSLSYAKNRYSRRNNNARGGHHDIDDDDHDGVMLKSFATTAKVGVVSGGGGGGGGDGRDGGPDEERGAAGVGIRRRVDIHVESSSASEVDLIEAEKGGRSSETGDDEAALTSHVGHPKATVTPPGRIGR